MKRILLLMFLLLSNSVIFSQTLYQPSQFNNVCDDNNDGFASFYMQEITSEIIGNNTNLVVTHHETQTDATIGINPLPFSYTNIVANVQTIYARVVNTTTSQVQILTYQLHVNPVPIANPYTMTVCAMPNLPGTASIDLNSTATIFSQNPGVAVTFYQSLTDAQIGINPLPSPYTNTVSNMQVFYVRIQNMVTGCFSVTQLYVAIVTCPDQPGVPQDLNVCVDTPNSACFDLTVNTPLIMGTANPANYTVSYHPTQANATAGINALPNTFCPTTSPYTVYARFAANNGSSINVTAFTLTSSTFQNATTALSTISQCDDNLDGVIVWDLTTVTAQLNTTNTLSYYTSLAGAQEMINAITNPAAFFTNVSPNLIPIFIREVVIGGCDIIHTVQLQGFANCNLASTCSLANSLCNSLGVPFANTVGVPSTGSASCLGSTPNPTWFYLPISGAGNISLQVAQYSNGGAPLDVDYIVYGPFTNPTSACTNPSLLLNSMVSCSYSTAAIENPIIPNAQPGQYYLMMVTNFANQPGQITITMNPSSQGAIDCSGLRLNAFLDSNANGIKDSGEVNFPLGQFHYEKNNNGTVHHITAPTGVYNIYDTNNTSTYNVSYTVDASYAAMYTVTPSSYSNLSVVLGSGLSSYYFPVTAVQNYTDLAVTIVPLTAPRPGFTYQNKIVYTNYGNQNIASGTVTFTKDPNVAITVNTQSGTTSNATGFTYNFTNLAPFESRNMTVTMQVPTTPTVAAGQTLTNSATIVPLSGDVVPENNSSTSAQVIINSYDPNDKVESHGGRILYSTFTSNDYLYYTIRFENSGTASAINVRVNDVLDNQLDETTLRMVSASHAYELDRVGTTLNWRFNNIQLPVSVANSTIGKGYITFKIKPKPGYALNDIIPNTASIYFDFNPAIVTNTFNTQFVAALGINEFANDNFVFYPNPTSGLVTVSLSNTESNITSITVYDVLGKTILTSKGGNVNTQTIDLSQVNSGIYFIEVTTDTNLKVVKKLIVN